MPEDLGAVIFTSLAVSLAAYVAFTLWLWFWRGLRRRWAMGRVARALSGASLSTRTGRAGWVVTVSGRLHGQPVRIAHDQRTDEYLTCAVRLDHAVDGLTIYPTFGLQQHSMREHRRTGRIATLEGGLDQKFAVGGAEGGAVTNMFRSGQLESALDTLFGPLGMMRVQSEGGWLVATGRLRRQAVVDADDALRIARTLLTIAPLLARRELKLELQGRSFALTGGGEGLMCPFCRDGLDVSPGTTGLLARCEECRTVHHTECYDEAGGCTVMGCKAQAQRRRAPRV